MAKANDDFGSKIGRNLQKQKDAKKGFGYLNLPKGVEAFVVDENTREVTLDFLPYEVTDPKHPDRDNEYKVAVPGSLWYRRPFKVHRNVGVNNETVVCLKSVGKPCPICEYQKKRMNEKAEKEEIVELYGKPRSLYAVIPVGMRKIEEKVHIWDMSDKLFQETLNDDLEIHPENRVFPSLASGKTAVLTLKWKSLGKVTYPEVRAIDFEDREPYAESILDEVPNLDEVLKILSYEEIEAKFFETDQEETGGDLHDVDDAPVHHRREEREEREERPRREREEAPSRTRRSRVEDDGDMPDNEPEEKPQERTRSRRTEKEPDEEGTTRKRKSAEVEKEEIRPQRGSAEGPYNKSEETTRSRRSPEPAEEKTKEKDRCPYGHRFGIDTEKFNDCDICNIWKACIDEKEGK